MLVRDKKAKEYYAMKILKKERVVAMRQVEHTLNEKRILSALNYPFLVKLIASGKDNSYLYLVLEFVSGGELFTLLRRLKRFPEAMVQFYSAQVVLAFEYLHAVDIVYRDLKPENLLIDSKGYLKVTDLGLAKLIKTNRTYTMCGTPEYLAPEIIQSRGYGKGVDWWATGILIFEMLAGQVPFYSNNHMRETERFIDSSNCR
uniref:Protein kinase domain-containing protein n=1 Tax=Trichuris muris TaxID=70415 RepID=A0A5S6QTK3_TRIMR